MAKMADLVENDLTGKGSISQRFIQFRYIYITKHKLETLGYHENKLVSYGSF